MLLSAFIMLLFSAICTQALTITYPDSKGWNRNVGHMTVLWSVGPQDPAMFSIELRDVGAGSVVNPLALAGNVESVLGQLTIDVPPVPISDTYLMMFVDVANVDRVLANSSVFPIYPDPPSATSEIVTQTMFTLPYTSQATTIPVSTSSETTILGTTTLTTTTLAITTPEATTSAAISSATTSSAATSSAITTPVTSSTLTSTTSSTTSIPSSSEPITRSTSSRMLTSISETSTPTIGIDPGATFVPVNEGLRCRSSGNWVGLLLGSMGFLVSVLTML